MRHQPLLTHSVTLTCSPLNNVSRILKLVPGPLRTFTAAVAVAGAAIAAALAAIMLSAASEAKMICLVLDICFP
jgi:hypothetical protein